MNNYINDRVNYTDEKNFLINQEQYKDMFLKKNVIIKYNNHKETIGIVSPT